ncbi:ASCH domain-containing protein [Serratia marcescens]|uniref:ASCH domain-containing protein n=1 Tax=Serratia marcescens TaxID=615 RepID=UPI0006ED1577|nr:ASCH domain-containing protein [Serratia marcescens]ALL37924.1 RNA-binding protein [Serratia marcescens]PHI47144.1 RNA-binding protein [Serratia marcescens]UJA56403.1 ASCH domain-containing protein [Serratia marcescens]CAI0852730.1 ASCH domain [Serratia marcescens]CAI0961373.1 ASCH domain [Serratia marcescens]
MATAIPQKYEHLERWAFGDTEQQADEVVQLILNGTKTATCSNLDGEGIPQAGDLFLVVDGKGEPVCVVELTAVEMKTYDQVDEAHAFAEGEGDRSLAHWRKELQRFFEAYDLFSPDMTLVLMNFKVVDKF